MCNLSRGRRVYRRSLSVGSGERVIPPCRDSGKCPVRSTPTTDCALIEARSRESRTHLCRPRLTLNSGDFRRISITIINETSECRQLRHDRPRGGRVNRVVLLFAHRLEISRGREHGRSNIAINADAVANATPKRHKPRSSAVLGGEPIVELALILATGTEKLTHGDDGGDRATGRSRRSATSPTAATSTRTIETTGGII